MNIIRNKPCPTCNQPREKLTEIIKPERIYKRVLEIGSNCITCGISFNDLYEQLINEGFEFDENGCLERCLREWFWTSFFHEEAHCEHENSKDDVTKLNEHLTCNFILRAESCMKLLTFKEADLNNDTAKENAKTAKFSNRVALIGLFISIITLLYSLYKDHNDNIEEIKYKQEIIELLKYKSFKSKISTSKLDTLIPNIP